MAGPDNLACLTLIQTAIAAIAATAATALTTVAMVRLAKTVVCKSVFIQGIRFFDK